MKARSQEANEKIAPSGLTTKGGHQPSQSSDNYRAARIISPPSGQTPRPFRLPSRQTTTPISKNDFTLAFRYGIKNACIHAGLFDFETGLPLPRQKNLLNLAFSAPESPKETLMQTAKMPFYMINNQQYTRCSPDAGRQFLGFKTAATYFEFNKPILKKEARILNDFEKNSTDFERFRMDFETQRQFENGNTIMPEAVKYISGILGIWAHTILYFLRQSAKSAGDCINEQVAARGQSAIYQLI